jgi:hypothetical protein
VSVGVVVVCVVVSPYCCLHRWFASAAVGALVFVRGASLSSARFFFPAVSFSFVPLEPESCGTRRTAVLECKEVEVEEVVICVGSKNGALGVVRDAVWVVAGVLPLNVVPGVLPVVVLLSVVVAVVAFILVVVVVSDVGPLESGRVLCGTRHTAGVWRCPERAVVELVFIVTPVVAIISVR